MKGTRPLWASKLRGWYTQAVEDVKRNLRPGFTAMSFDCIRWQVTNRASRKAGVCWAYQKRIWLHAAMTEEQALSTFRHELAHLFAFWYESSTGPADYGHGPVFVKWAKAMGDDGGRCHNYAEVLATRRGDWAHCPSCPLELKKIWKNGIANYWCKKCKAAGRPATLVLGRRHLQNIAAQVTIPTAVKVCAEVAADPSETVGVKIRSLKLELGLLKEGGLASSPEAKKIRVMLRKLDPEWRTNG